MGLCGSARDSKHEEVEGKCQEVEEKIGLSKVDWKGFASTMTMYADTSSSLLKAAAIQVAVNKLGLEPAYADPTSALRRFFVAMKFQDDCQLRDVLVTGLFLCSSPCEESGCYLWFVLNPTTGDELLADFAQFSGTAMTIALRVIPQLAKDLNPHSTTAFGSLINIDEGTLNEAVRRWLPCKLANGKEVVAKADLDIQEKNKILRYNENS